MERHGTESTFLQAFRVIELSLSSKNVHIFSVYLGYRHHISERNDAFMTNESVEIFFWF